MNRSGVCSTIVVAIEPASALTRLWMSLPLVSKPGLTRLWMCLLCIVPNQPAVACCYSPQGAHAAGRNCTQAEAAADQLNGARSDVHVNVLMSLILVFDAVLPNPSAQRSLPPIVQKRLLGARTFLPPLRSTVRVNYCLRAHKKEAKGRKAQCCGAGLGRN